MSGQAHAGLTAHACRPGVPPAERRPPNPVSLRGRDGPRFQE